MNWFKKIANKDYVSCLMAMVDGEISKEIKQWQSKNINEDMLAPGGFPEYPHITVQYGLYTKDGDLMREFCKSIKPFKIELKKMDIFEQDESDVLIVKVDSDVLKNINEDIRKTFGYETDYPNYTPHLTIAYLKKGQADKFKSDNSFNNRKIMISKMRFSVSQDDDKDIQEYNL